MITYHISVPHFGTYIQQWGTNFLYSLHYYLAWLSSYILDNWRYIFNCPIHMLPLWLSNGRHS